MKKSLLLITLLLILSACAQQPAENKFMFKNIRPAAVAGQFYSASQTELKNQIEKFLAQAPEQKIKGKIKALMVPHAGYDFSGQVAAYAYKQLLGRSVKNVFLVGNSHTSYFPGIAIDDSEAWQTPLGLVPLNQELAKNLLKTGSLIKFNSSAHGQEHSLEVQLPFLQTVLKGDFKIVPLLFGNFAGDDYLKLAQVLKDNLSQDDLVIISTDMSHYPSYGEANTIDQETLAKIKATDLDQLSEHIQKVESQKIAGEETLLCALDAVKTVIKLYHLAGWQKAEILKYANSGDVSIGDKERVVGYGAVAFAKIKNEKQKIKNDELSQLQQRELLKIVKETVENFVTSGKVPEYNLTDQRLNQQQGAFVTLRKNGELRGCIGQILPSQKPLWQVVREMAIAACSQDYRFSPVKPEELPEIDYEVSVLSQPEKINNWQEVELGQDGVIVQKGASSGVFLPQVATETGWSKEEFLSQLCWQKAGLAPDCYKNDPEAEIQVFTAQVFSD